MRAGELNEPVGFLVSSLYNSVMNRKQVINNKHKKNSYE